MQKSNSNTKIVYSLRVHTLLQMQGFNYVCVMPNPQNEQYNCWVYERTPAFLKAFEEILKGGRDNE